jgi:hypothetical protein
VDFTSYPPNQINPFLRAHQQFDFSINAFTPPLMISDFWLTSYKFIEINATIPNSLNLTLNFNSYEAWKCNYITSFQYSADMHDNLGVTESDKDNLKELFTETSSTLLAVTMVVSLLHTIFEVMAFKSDIQFWNDKDSLEGMSIKTLYIQIVSEVIIMLYLLDN